MSIILHNMDRRRLLAGTGTLGLALLGGAPRLALAQIAKTQSSLYDASRVRTIALTFPMDDWEARMEALHQKDEDLPATAVVDGVTYRDVGVGFRGSSSFFRVRSGQKRPLKLKFDRVHKEQALDGYRTLNLLNGNNDPTFLRSWLYSRIANAYLPAPKVGFVHLVINGESWGIYPNQQQFNSEFLVDFFGKGGGARWKAPGSPRGGVGLEYWPDALERYKSAYEIDTKDTQESWQKLVGLTRVLNEGPAEGLPAALDPFLNVDGALRFLAVDVALVNSDGYWTRASDYNLYLDPTGRFHVLPHDMNEAFSPNRGGGGGGQPGGSGRPPFPAGASGAPPEMGGGFGRGVGGRGPGGGEGNARLDPLVAINDSGKPLRSRLLAVPAWRRRYLEYVLDIAQNHLDWTRTVPAARDVHALIADKVRTDNRKLYSNEAFASGLEEGPESLKAFFDTRRAYLLETVPGLIAATGGAA